MHSGNLWPCEVFKRLRHLAHLDFCASVLCSSFCLSFSLCFLPRTAGRLWPHSLTCARLAAPRRNWSSGCGRTPPPRPPRHRLQHRHRHRQRTARVGGWARRRRRARRALRRSSTRRCETTKHCSWCSLCAIVFGVLPSPTDADFVAKKSVGENLYQTGLIPCCLLRRITARVWTTRGRPPPAATAPAAATLRCPTSALGTCLCPPTWRCVSAPPAFGSLQPRP